MRVGRLFTHNGRRYEPGSDFDISGVAEFQRTSFIRLFGLEEQPPKRTKNKKKKQQAPAEPDWFALEEEGMEDE